MSAGLSRAQISYSAISTVSDDPAIWPCDLGKYILNFPESDFRTTIREKGVASLEFV
jgi:hypothetical protein